MQEFFQVVKEQFYMPFLLYAVIIACIVISIIKRKKHPELNWVPFYAIGYLIGEPGLVLYTRSGMDPHIAYSIQLNYENGYTFLEFILYSLFLYSYLGSLQKKIYAALAISFTVIFLFFTIKGNFPGPLQRPVISRLYTAEGLLLATLCILYFTNLVKKLPVGKLTRFSPFWIAVGLLFLQITLLPLSLIEDYLFKNFSAYASMLFSLYSVFYTINFSMVIYAFLCPPINQL